MSTLKKTKYRDSVTSRGRERIRKACLRFDILSGILALLFVGAVIAAEPHAYELGANRPEGFATWFLLFLAYLPLEIVGLVTWLFGIQDSTVVHFLVEQRQTLALGLFDLAMLVTVWAAVRFYCSRRYGVNFVRTANAFMTILVAWGVFQLGCMAAVVIWERGGFSPLHRHLRRASEPERVIVVEKTEVPPAKSAPMPKNP